MLDLKAIRFIQGTKISHDYEGNNIETFSYRDLINRNVPAIGIPCKPNGLIVIDVDVAGANHKKDGREWWTNFCENFGMPQTYTVQTQSGGYHFYFKLPESVNPETFNPPAELALGVDIKWKGWVGAPPTEGYSVLWGNISKIVVAPPSLMAEIARILVDRNHREFSGEYLPGTQLRIHRPFTPDQIEDLYKKIEWVQTSGELSYSEWRDGLFSLKAGVEDIETLHDLATKWSYNKSYQIGDESKAIDIVDRADSNGNIGPGTILNLIKNMKMRSGAIESTSPYTKSDIITLSKVPSRLDKNMEIVIAATESNAAALLGVMLPKDDLYHDIRQDLYMYKGTAMDNVQLVNTITPMIQSETYGIGLVNFGMGVIASGVEILLNTRRIDPHREWLESLVWDGVDRIDYFFSNYVGTEQSDYIRAVSKNLWIALAARGLQPGVKFDNVVVIEGAEGIRKSALVASIGGIYTFAPSTKKVMYDTDELRKMHQSTIVELPELMGLMGQDSETVKAFLSKNSDHIRGLFARKALHHKRGFLFIGTTNNKKYLSADMGERRFWPIEIPITVKQINTWKIETDRAQLFAEAVVRFKKGESFHVVPNEHSEEVKNRAIRDPLLGSISDIIPTLGGVVKIADVYSRLSLGGFLSCGLTPHIAKRLEESLKTLGLSENVSNHGSTWEKVEELSSFI